MGGAGRWVGHVGAVLEVGGACRGGAVGGACCGRCWEVGGAWEASLSPESSLYDLSGRAGRSLQGDKVGAVVSAQRRDDGAGWGDVGGRDRSPDLGAVVRHRLTDGVGGDEVARKTPEVSGLSH